MPTLPRRRVGPHVLSGLAPTNYESIRLCHLAQLPLLSGGGPSPALPQKSVFRLICYMLNALNAAILAIISIFEAKPVVTASRHVTKETDMKRIKVLPWARWSLACMLATLPSLAADYPAPQEGSWVVRDFRFHTGQVLPELRLHHTTVGAPSARGA